MLNSENGVIMRGNAAIVHFLEEKGIRYIFHLPGVHTLPLNHALIGSKIKVVMGRHESFAGFTADGFSRATGEAAVLLTMPGPGLGNVVSTCMEAHADDVPLLIMAIEVERKNVEKGILHGIRAPETLFGSIAKAVFIVSGVADLLGKLEASFRTAAAARQGPVVIFIPYDVLEKEGTFSVNAAAAHEEKEFDPAPLEKALEGSRRPVIIGGGGLTEDGIRGLLDAVCRDSAVPFLNTTGGKGVLSGDREYVLGSVAAKGVAREVLRRADLTIALATRLRDVDTKKRGVKLGRLVHLDVDDRWLGRNYRTELAAAGPMKKVVECLHGLMKGKKSSWDMEQLKGTQKREEALLEATHIGFRIVKRLRRLIPDETVTVWDLNLVAYWAELYFPAYRPRSFLSPRGIAPIFYAFPASLGAKLANPEKPCLCVTGDGSFSAVAAELATVAKYDIPVVILVYNNGAFGLLEGYMRKRYGASRVMELHNPDFVALARAYGIKAKRTARLDGLERIFRRDIAWDEPYLVEFSCPLFSPPWE
jgi:acetolactate synthase-1/2/3 large subunit